MAQQVQIRTEAQAHQSFLRESQKIFLWAEGVQAQLHSKEELVDVTSAQRLLREHRDLQEEMHLWQERSELGGRQGILRVGQDLRGLDRKGGQEAVWSLGK
jgi:hypothetical protein